MPWVIGAAVAAAFGGGFLVGSKTRDLVLLGSVIGGIYLWQNVK